MNTVWILGDQLSPEHAALSQTSPAESRVLMIGSKARGSVLRLSPDQACSVTARCGISRVSCANVALHDAPLNSVEGHVRQIIDWREFINGVYWLRGPDYKSCKFLGAEQPSPKWFYTGETEMNCLHHVLQQTLALGWNHQIERLMVIGDRTTAILIGALAAAA